MHRPDALLHPLQQLSSRGRAAALLATLVLILPLLQPAPAHAAGFRLVFQDNFNGQRIDHNKWGVYNGGNGGDRVAANTIVQDGKLILRTRKVNGVWKGAGVSAARANKQTYGKYEMRVRFDRGYGVRAVGLLWPVSGGWPPEVDFYELPADKPNRQLNTLTNHYRTNTSRHRMHHASYTGDFTRWQTVSVEWTPNRLIYKMNGVTQAVMTQNVPRKPMWLGLQTRAGSNLGVKPNGTTPAVVDMEVDWVKVYSYDS